MTTRTGGVGDPGGFGGFEPQDRAGPYAHAANSVAGIMIRVMAALTPATLAGIYLFGWPALNLFVITILTAVVTEAACLALGGRPVLPALSDGSAVLTGWLLALSLPAWAPWWIGVTGAVIALTFGKHMFGGLGQNPFNPAMVARVALLISFPVPMTLYVAPAPMFSAGAPGFLDGLAVTFWGVVDGGGVDGVTAASPLGHIKTELSRGVPVAETMAAAVDPAGLAFGMIPGSLGESSALLLALGGLILLWRGVISWAVPVALLASLGAIATIAHTLDPGRHADATVHLLAGATMLGAFFIATDPVTSPVTRQGQLLFGVGCGVLVWVIRSFAGYPEGMAFAILLMNAVTPLIDRGSRPRVHGRTRGGEPLTRRTKAKP